LSLRKQFISFAVLAFSFHAKQISFSFPEIGCTAPVLQQWLKFKSSPSVS
jgi:hypothetical protein